MMMKRICTIILMTAIILLSSTGAYGVRFFQNVSQDGDTLYNWSTSDVEYLIAHKVDFARKEMGVLNHFLQQRKMRIGGLWGKGTSPWFNPSHLGRSYVRKFYIYSRDFSNLVKGDNYYKIDVTLDYPENDTTIVFDDFWNSFDENKAETEQFFQKTEHLPVKCIEISSETIRYD